jgi:hypothetical protein
MGQKRTRRPAFGPPQRDYKPRSKEVEPLAKCDFPDLESVDIDMATIGHATQIHSSAIRWASGRPPPSCPLVPSSSRHNITVAALTSLLAPDHAPPRVAIDSVTFASVTFASFTHKQTARRLDPGLSATCSSPPDPLCL